MAQAYIGEIKMFAGDFAPVGWLFCNGASLAIADNATLFTLIGTTYGGNGVDYFNLPDLRGRLAMHQGNGYVPGQRPGSEDTQLVAANLPIHTHGVAACDAPANTDAPSGMVLAQGRNGNTNSAVAAYLKSNAPTLTPINPASVSQTGQGSPLSIRQPTRCIHFIIATVGIFPSPN